MQCPYGRNIKDEGNVRNADIQPIPLTYHLHRHRRRSLRLRGYDYSSQGAYFVTICTYQRDCLFGKIESGKTQLSPFGQIAEDCWKQIPAHFPNSELDEFVVIPNHLHGIVVIQHTVAQSQPDVPPAATFGKMMRPGTLSTIVRSFKSATTREINLRHGVSGLPIWQRNYYDHIIRDVIAYQRIKSYIQNNPSSWQEDQLHPGNPSKW